MKFRLGKFELSLGSAGASPDDGEVAQPQASVFGEPSSGFRSSAEGHSLTDLRVARPVERQRAVKASRFLRAKLGVIRALVENTARYSLGRGLAPTSLVPEWGKRADEYFESVTGRKGFDVREECNFRQMQKLVLPDVITDGDAGAAPVRDAEGNPRLQMFPGDAIGNGMTGLDVRPGGGRRWVDGVLRSAEGTPLAYRVMVGAQDGWSVGPRRYRDFPAEFFHHVGRPDRIGANRPLPWLYHGDQSAVNILDLNALEMAAAKLNSYFAGSIKTAGGDLPTSMEDMLAKETKSFATEKEGTDGPEAAVKETQQRLVNLYGAAALIPLKDDEEFEFFKNDRPSTTFTGFIDYLVSDIAVGFGVPPQFVWALTGMAGPQARLVLQQADWFFEDVADMMVCDFCQPVWEGVVADGMNRGLVPPPPRGVDWRAVQWQGPGSMTIDKGRDGKLFRDMVLTGMARRSTWHEMNGRNGERENRAAIDEIADLLAYCEEKGVPPEYFFGKDFAAPGGGDGGGSGGPDPEEVARALLEEMEREGLRR